MASGGVASRWARVGCERARVRKAGGREGGIAAGPLASENLLPARRVGPALPRPPAAVVTAAYPRGGANDPPAPFFVGARSRWSTHAPRAGPAVRARGESKRRLRRRRKRPPETRPLCLSLALLFRPCMAAQGGQGRRPPSPGEAKVFCTTLRGGSRAHAATHPAGERTDREEKGRPDARPPLPLFNLSQPLSTFQAPPPLPLSPWPPAAPPST